MPPLIALRRDFGRSLSLLGQRWRREMDLAMRRFNLTDATWRPLYYLGSYGDGLRQTDLAAALGIEGPSLVRLVDALERDGLLRRELQDDDRRVRLLHLTDQGRDTYVMVAAEYDRYCAIMLGGITELELRSCADILARISADLAAGLPPDAA